MSKYLYAVGGFSFRRRDWSSALDGGADRCCACGHRSARSAEGRLHDSRHRIPAGRRAACAEAARVQRGADAGHLRRTDGARLTDPAVAAAVEQSIANVGASRGRHGGRSGTNPPRHLRTAKSASARVQWKAQPGEVDEPPFRPCSRPCNPRSRPGCGRVLGQCVPRVQGQRLRTARDHRHHRGLPDLAGHLRRSRRCRPADHHRKYRCRHRRAGHFRVAALIDMPSAALSFALMLGLSCGIDYALFILNRYRNNLLLLGRRRRPQAWPRYCGRRGRLRRPHGDHRPVRAVHRRHPVPDLYGAGRGGFRADRVVDRGDLASGFARLRGRSGREVHSHTVRSSEGDRAGGGLHAAPDTGRPVGTLRREHAETPVDRGCGRAAPPRPACLRVAPRVAKRRFAAGVEYVAQGVRHHVAAPGCRASTARFSWSPT